MSATFNPEAATADSYRERLEQASVEALWHMEIRSAPVVTELPHVWRWSDCYPLLEEAGASMQVGADAQRRALVGRNPGGGFGTTHSMVAAYQMVMPGEVAPAHRHTPGAIRLMLQGRGFTVVNGEEFVMNPGDLVLTPGQTWHDHRNEGSEPMVWLDGLDVPFVRALRSAFQEDYPGNAVQPISRQAGTSTRMFGSGLLPTKDLPDAPYSPLKHYSWDAAYSALQGVRDELNDPHEGVKLEYTNPLTGGHVLPTMACYVHLLVSGVETLPLRHTSSTIFCALAGHGTTTAGGSEFAWEQNDFFAIPAWSWYHHRVETEAILFALSDRPTLEPFHLYREERSN